MKTVLRHAIIATLLAAVVVFPERVFAASVVWTNTAGGNWNVTNNWSPNTVPGAADIAYITNSGTYIVTQNVAVTLSALFVGGTSGTQTLQNSGFTLTLNGASSFDTNSAFSLAGGILDGTGQVVIAGNCTWSAGDMAGTGRTVFTNSATVTLSTGGIKRLYTRTVDNYTTVNYPGDNFQAGGSSVWNNQGGANFDIQSNGSIAFSSIGNFATFNNYGSLKKTAGGGVSSVVMTVNNAGGVFVTSGNLSLDYGGSSSGLFHANPGCTNQFGGQTHTLLAGARFTGPGLYRVLYYSTYNPSTLDIAAPITITNNFELDNGGGIGGGAVGGTSTVVFAGPVNWAGGDMNGTGRTVFTNSATVTLSTGGIKRLYTRTVDNYTTVNYPGDNFQAGGSSVWNNQGGANFDIQSNGSIAFSSIGNFATFNNYGSLKKTAGGGVSSVVMTVNNAGGVFVTSGNLSLDYGGSSSGLFHANPGCTNQFGGQTHTLLAGARFTGPGLYRVLYYSTYNPSTLDIAAPITITNNFELDNGGGIGGGAVGGTSTVVFAGPVNWAGGDMNGTGRTVFTNSATVTLSTGGIKRLYTRTVDNYTTVNYPGDNFQAGGSSVWNNQGGANFDIQSNGSIAFSSIGNFATFNNYGSLKKTAGGGVSSVVMTVNNSGTVRSQIGQLDLPITYTQAAGLTEMAGGNLSGTLLDIQGGLLTGTGNIAANVHNNAQVAPGTGVGLTTISNTIVQTYTSTTNSLVTFQIGGLTPGSGHDQLRLNNGTATLAGTLMATLANGHIPTPGNTYTVMVFTARSGTFTNFSFPDYEFGVIHTTNHVILVASNARPTVTITVPSTQLVCTAAQLISTVNDLDGTVTNLQVLVNVTNLLANYNNPPNGSTQKVSASFDFPSPVTFSAVATDNAGYTRTASVTTVFYTLPLHVLNLGGKLTNGAFKFCMLGESGKNYDVLLNTNLNFPSNWTAIGVMENTNGIWRFTDPAGTNFGPRYYRARQQ